MENVIIQIDADPKGLQPLVDAMQTIGGLTDEQIEKFNQINASYAAGKKLIDAQTDALSESASQVGIMAKNMQDVGKAVAGGAVKDATNQVKELGEETATTTEKHLKLRTQLMNAKQALYDLAESTGRGTKQYQEQAKVVGGLEMNMKELNIQVSALGNKTKVISGVASAASGVASAFAAMQGVMVLSGKENESFEKSMERLTGVLVIANGLREFELTLSEQNAARILIETGQYHALSASVELETAVQSENIIVSKAAAAATWLLNIAIEANPVMILVGAITVLVGALLYFTRETKDATDRQVEFNTAQREGFELIKKRVEIENAAAADDIKAAELRVEALKSQRAPLAGIAAAELELQNKRIASTKSQAQQLSISLDDLKKYRTLYIAERKYMVDELEALEKSGPADNKDLKKKVDAKKQEIQDLTNKIDLTQGLLDQSTKEEAEKQDLVDQEKARKHAADLQASVTFFKKQAIQSAEFSNEERKAKISTLQKQAELQTNDLVNDEAYANNKMLIQAKLTKDISDLNQEYRVKALEEAKQAFDAQNLLVKQGTKTALNLKLQDIDKQAAIDKEKVKDGKYAVQQRANIDAKANADKSAATTEFNNKERADDYAAQLAINQAHLELLQKGSNDELSIKKKVIKAEYDAQINSINTSMDNEGKKAADILKANADLKKKLQDASTSFLEGQVNQHKDHNDKVTSLAQATNEAVQGDPNASAQEKVDAQKKVLQAEQDGMKQQMADNTALNLLKEQQDGGDTDQRAKDSEAFVLDQQILAKKIAANKEAQQKLQRDKDLEDAKMAATAAVNVAKQASDAIFTQSNANRNRNYDLQIAMLEKQSAFELDNNNLTQAQKIAIQRKFDKEVAAVKLQQWKADQKAKEEQAIINGALAITAIIAASPPAIGIVPNPAFFISMATAVASTAASVAMIAAQKPPAFAKGTPKGTGGAPYGLSWVGEQGPELIHTNGGERIIPHAESMKIMDNYGIPVLPPMPNFATGIHAPYIDEKVRAMYDKGGNDRPFINEDSLAKKIAEHVGKQTRPHLTVDKNGVNLHMMSGNSKRTVLNNKYEFDG